MARLPAAAVLAAAVLAGAAAVAAGSDLAGYYEGDLPCADCAGIRYRLELRGDRAYVLQTEYRGRADADATHAELGVWSEAADGSSVILRSGARAPQLFAVAAPGVLRKLDASGRPIESKLGYDLRRRTPAAPFTPLLRLEGAYSYLDDAGVFQECLSRLRLPVATEADNAALDRAYLAVRGAPGESVLMTVQARIEARPGAGGAAPADMLVVERFIGAWPGESCGDPLAMPGLVGTDWRLTRLDGHAVVLPAGARAPSLTLYASGNRAEGFGGCNDFMGSFQSEGNTLRFGRLAATMMACPRTMEQEQDYLTALNAARQWRIDGEHLEILDSDGRLLARFEARHRDEQDGEGR